MHNLILVITSFFVVIGSIFNKMPYTHQRALLSPTIQPTISVPTSPPSAALTPTFIIPTITPTLIPRPKITTSPTLTQQNKENIYFKFMLEYIEHACNLENDKPDPYKDEGELWLKQPGKYGLTTNDVENVNQYCRVIWSNKDHADELRQLIETQDKYCIKRGRIPPIYTCPSL